MIENKEKLLAEIVADSKKIEERLPEVDHVSDLLFIREEPVVADIAIVFGAADKKTMLQRVRRACELYNSNFISMMLLSGGGNHETEAKQMMVAACKYGVPEGVMLPESKSHDTATNVKCCISLLEEQNLLEIMDTIILVSSEWHMKRTLTLAKIFWPRACKFVCCPTLQGINRENWKNSSQYKKMILKEWVLFEYMKRSFRSRKPK